MAPLVLLTATGCLSHTRVVQTVHPPSVVMNATPEDLVSRLNAQFNSIQSLTATVEVVASVGGGATGKVTEYHPFQGYIIIQKPKNLRVLLQVPLVGSVGMDMVSDGQNFKLKIPIESRAMIGKDEVVKASPKPLENLRPGVFFDSMFIPGLGQDEVVAQTESSRMIQPESHKQSAIEEPDYDLTILRNAGEKKILQTLRVVHVSRTALMPYRQDIYDEAGRLTTSATYDNWQRFKYTDADGKPGEIQFPILINIDRPLDQYALKITVTKVTANQKMEPDQFELCIPGGYKVRNMDDPDSAPVTAPSSACGQQSQH